MHNSAAAGWGSSVGVTIGVVAEKKGTTVTTIMISLIVNMV